MFLTVQNRIKSTLSYFEYGSKPSSPAEIPKGLENQELSAERTLQDHRITSTPPSIWKRVASLGMSYLVFSSGQWDLRETLSSGVEGYISEPWALPITFVAGLSIFPDMVHAQSPQTTFFKVFGGTNNEQGRSIATTPEGDLIVAGYTTSFGAVGEDVLLAKLSSNGTLLWANTLGGASSDYSYALTVTPEGDLVVTGLTESFGAGGADVLLSKFSSNGTLLWANTLGGASNDQGWALTVTPEGDLIVAGHTYSLGVGSDDMLLSKFSSDGTLVWTTTLGGTNDDQGYSLTATSEGDLIVVGQTRSFGAGSFDVLLSKFSSNGTLLWATTLGGASNDHGRALTTTSKGDLIVAGHSSSFGTGGYDVFFSKFSSNGTLVWANTLGGASNDQSWALATTSDGDLIIAGSTFSFGTGNDDVFFSKFSSNGTLVWANTLGGANSGRSRALMITTEGDLIVAGSTSSFGAGSDDVLLAKFDMQGVIGDCSAWQSVTPQVQSITPNITDVTLNMTTGIPPWTVQDARSALNVTDIANLLNQTTVCYAQTSRSSETHLSNSQDSKKSDLTSAWSSLSLKETTDVSEPSPTRGGMIPSITILVYEESYPIIVNGETVGTFYFTGGSGQLDSNNVNTLNIQLDGDIVDGETITLFTIPEGEEPLWEDIVLSNGSECVTTEGAFTTSEEEHSYQLIFQHESSECSQYSVALKLSVIQVLVGGLF